MSVRQRFVAVTIAGLSLAGATVVATSPADAAEPKANCGRGYELWNTVPINWYYDTRGNGHSIYKHKTKPVGYLSWYGIKLEDKTPLCAVVRPVAKYRKTKHLIRVAIARKNGKSTKAEEKYNQFYGGPVHALFKDTSQISGWIKIGGKVYRGQSVRF